MAHDKFYPEGRQLKQLVDAFAAVDEAKARKAFEWLVAPGTIERVAEMATRSPAPFDKVTPLVPFQPGDLHPSRFATN